MSYFPNNAWSVINKLKEWIQGHHVTLNIMSEDNTYTKNDEESPEMLSTHFEIVFNSAFNIDWTILSEIK